ncbi:hypothetical protein JTB14_016093 [Gonioctena quinquepunctata]|nr:hypothetical protein JTB14_016093 [Gonioctena quinquepunctata]
MSAEGISFLITIIFILFAVCAPYSEVGIRSAFGSKFCIQSSLVTLNENYFALGDSESPTSSVTQHNTTSESPERSPLSRINEVIQYNELDYYYELEKEEGPPHDRLFTVSLTIGKETFMGEGKSLKKAQRNAAANALANTKYDIPLQKESSENDEALTPTVLLNNLCAKLGLGVTYLLIDKDKQLILKSNLVVDEKVKRSYIQKLNDSIHADNSLRMRKDIDQIKGPFKVKVQVGEHIFFGHAHSIQAARHEAASNAVDFLIQNKDNLDLDCLNEGSSEKCEKAKQSLKSPISLLYEAAQMQKLDIEFEIIEESGPPHKKTFVTECRLAQLRTIGRGSSKKESKKEAAEQMLGKMSELEPVSQEMQVQSMLKDKKKKKKKNKKIIKNKLDAISMSLGNALDSVVDFGKDLLQTGNEANDGSDTPKSKKPSKSKNIKRSNQDLILQISNTLNFEISYSDFEDSGKKFSLLSLHLNPQHICYGLASNGKDARVRAANNGLDLLKEIGIYDLYLDQKQAPLERDTKEAVREVFEYYISKDKEEL